MVLAEFLGTWRALPMDFETAVYWDDDTFRDWDAFSRSMCPHAQACVHHTYLEPHCLVHPMSCIRV